ncbi:hypothetical protein Tco_0079309 [Tanacetum coccineum]
METVGNQVVQHSEQPGFINDTYVVEMDDSNVIPDSSDMCDNEGKAHQNAEEPEDQRTGYSLKDKNEAKTDKTEHGIGKSVKKSKSKVNTEKSKSKTKPKSKKYLKGQPCGFSLSNGTCINCTYGDGKPVTCCECESPLNGGFCLFCNSRAGNSSAYDPNPNSYNDSPNFSDYTPQPQYQPILCEFCGNDARYGHYCTPQVPIISNPEPCYNQNYDEFPQTLPSFQQQILCCENCGGPHATFECQPMNQNFHDSNSSGFDQFQPPQFPVIHQPPKEMRMEALQAREDLMESIQNFLKKFNRISFRETPKVLMQAWDKFFEVKHAQSEERLIYDNSTPRPPEDFQANFDMIIESLPTFPIPVEGSDSFREEIDIFPGPNDSIPPGIESDDDVVEDIPVDVPNILATHPALQLDFDCIPSINDLGSDLNDSSPSGDRKTQLRSGIMH